MMKQTDRMINSRVLLCCSLLFFVLSSHAQTENKTDMVIEFNKILFQAAEAEDGFLTLKGLRTATMAHIAIHDSLNLIDPRFETYTNTKPKPEANATVAIVHSAFIIANRFYPEEPKLREFHTSWLAKISDGDSKSRGKELGEKIANALLEQRANDNWNTEAEYQFHPMGPGVYAEFNEHSDTPQGFIFGTGWAKAKGFALKKPDQFRVPPPPKISSDAYEKAFNEVKDLGRFQSMHRTPDQTHLALWWKDFAENAQNRLARDLIKNKNISVHDATRLFALLNISIYDAYISSFENKFHYNHWRPFTAIRWASNDGNPATVEELTWTNTHRHTYAFPSYPSAHGTACAAAAVAFAEVLGDKTEFNMRNPVADIAGPFSGKINMQPETRSFKSFSDSATECGLSRVYLGIHFRYDSEEGVKLGKKVGENVVDNFLKPKK